MPSRDADRAFLAGLTLLYVEDDVAVQAATAVFLRRRVARLCVAGDGEEGLEVFRREQPDLVVTDILMPKISGLDLAEAVKAERPGVPVLVTTAFEQTHFLLRAIALGVDRYVLKPVDPDQFEAALLHCARSLRMDAELAALRKEKLDLLQARHEESLGLLASGMAHDYNNLFQSIITMTTMARLTLGEPAKAAEFLSGLEPCWQQAKALGQSLIQLADRRDAGRRTGALEPVLRAALASALGATATAVTWALPEGLPAVRFQEAQLDRVFQSLARNASEAMAGGGVLRVEGEALEVEPQGPLGLAAGPYLRLRISDQGPGLDPALLPALFCPYASTKARGQDKGVGLSLAIARAILKLHGGAVTAENAVAGGAVFSLYLPIPEA
jgi:signal transduction histidine kinase